MSGHPSWCTVCHSGPTKAVSGTHSWCTNCGALYTESSTILPTKIGPDPKERRGAWDLYAASHGVSKADDMLAARDKRFCASAQVAEPAIAAVARVNGA